MIYRKILNTIKENGLVTRGQTVIAAVSGGADSVCLLDVLTKLAPELCITVEAAHLNHCLRGQESDGDEQYVRELCREKGITLHVKSVDVKALSEKRSTEDAAREARYEYFAELVKGRNAAVATAHTVNDNVETFFINLARGSGTRGLCSIPFSREGIIRPMLGVTRDEIINHLEKAGLEYRTDSTNYDTDYLRNFIRHKILAEFKTRKDIDIYKSVSRAITNLQKDSEALELIANESATDDCEKLLLLNDAVLYRVLTNKLETEFGIILDSNHFYAIKSLLEKHNSKVQIKGDVFAENSYGKLRFYREVKKQLENVPLALGENKVMGKTVLIKKAKEVYKALTNNCVDCDKIGNSFYVRTRRDGDIFYCMYRNGTSRLKKLFINDKLTKHDRDTRLIVCSADGQTVFVEGYGADDRFAADTNSKNVISIEIF